MYLVSEQYLHNVAALICILREATCEICFFLCAFCRKAQLMKGIIVTYLAIRVVLP